MRNRTVMMILAGGKGSRLVPLTCHRAKPSVPFAGRYRIIDFVLSNVVNSGYARVYVLTQYMASSLIKHLNRNWHISGIGSFVEVAPAQMRTGGHWYLGTADAVHQNANLIRDARCQNVGVFGGDHIYKLAIDQMEAYHNAKQADLTVAAFPVPRAEAHQFGVIEVDAEGRMTGFQEKPADPTPMPGHPDTCLVSMGNYFFKAPGLLDALRRDAALPDSSHDFGKDIIPEYLAKQRKVYVYDFAQCKVPGEPADVLPYWRDVGTIDSYFQANMEVRSPLPAVNLYNRQWRIRTAQRDYPPARLVRDGEVGTPTVSSDTLICEGSIACSSTLGRSVIGYDCFIRAGCRLEDCILLAGCDIGEGSHLRRVLMDKNCKVAPGTQIGIDPAADRIRFPWITESGIVVLPKGTVVPREGPIQLAWDMHDIFRRDPHTREAMAAWEERVVQAQHFRHSYASQGPRYETDPAEGEEG